MNNCFLVILLIITLSILRLHGYSNNIFSKNTLLLHPETSLFLDYVGLYTPSETIIHTSAIFPMTAATCYFLPLSAAEKISSCNITTKRRKRFVDVISLAVGSASLAVSVSNSLQIGKLQQQVMLVENSLSKVSQITEIHGTQLARLSLKHIEVTEELQVTQKALNDMIPVLNSHSAAINNFKVGFEDLRIQMQHSFLYLAITQICRNDLTLSFLSPGDIHKIVSTVIKEGNLTFNSYPGSLPVVHIITKLLVRQQIDFVVSDLEMVDNPEEIGRLVITSYFAVPRQEQLPFYIYKLVTIPFFHENETIELTQIPRYWAINPVNNITLEWHNPEESGCDLGLMTSCRDTPPFRTISKETCFGQIIKRLPISRCRTTPAAADKYFLRQLRDNLWITSSSASVHCVKMPRIQYLNNMEQTLGLNEEIILPPLSLINVTEGYTIACPDFTLVGRPITPNMSSLVILHSSEVFTKNISVMNVHEYITENMTWFKKNVAEQERGSLMDFINQTKAVSARQNSVFTNLSSFGILTSNWILFGLFAALIYYIYRHKRRSNLVNL